MGPGEETVGLAACQLVGGRGNQGTDPGLIRNRTEELVQGSLEVFLIYHNVPGLLWYCIKDPSSNYLKALSKFEWPAVRFS